MAVIFHCTKKALYESRMNDAYWGYEEVQKEGFIHFSQPFYFWRVAPNFRGVNEEMVLVVVDTDKLESDLKYEDGDNCGREYPHLYGPVNRSAIIDVLSFSLNEKGEWDKNPEFQDYTDI